MQKVLDTLRKQGSKKPNFSKKQRPTNKKNKQELDIISQAKLACNQYIKQMDKISMNKTRIPHKFGSELQIYDSDEEKSNRYEPSSKYRTQSQVKTSSVHKNKYRDYLLNEDEPFSTGHKDSYLNKEYWGNIFQNPDSSEEDNAIVMFSKKKNLNDCSGNSDCPN